MLSEPKAPAMVAEPPAAIALLVDWLLLAMLVRRPLVPSAVIGADVVV